MVTILADNYFGYCKKEVKTQIGYGANLFGLAEEEHAGGALAFATYSLGDHFLAGPRADRQRQTIGSPKSARCWATAPRFHAEGYATDTLHPDIALHAGGHGDRHPPAGHQLDAAGADAAPQAAAGPDLHPPQRLQGADGEAPRPRRAGG